MLRGPNLELLHRVCEETDKAGDRQRRHLHLEDILALRDMVEIGVEGAIIGTALYVGRFTIEEALVAAQLGSTTGSNSMTAATAATGRSVQRLDGRLRDLLAGKKIVMTGVTGFIGEQLLWKILTDLPDTCPSVLVRRKGSASAQDRMIAVVKSRSSTIFGRRPGGSGASRPELRSSRATCPMSRNCRPILTSWCTAPATSPLIRRSTRPSPPT